MVQDDTDTLTIGGLEETKVLLSDILHEVSHLARAGIAPRHRLALSLTVGDEEAGRNHIDRNRGALPGELFHSIHRAPFLHRNRRGGDLGGTT